MLVIGDAVESVEGRLVAPMPAKVIRVAAGVGDRVARGDVLLVLAAMKMEHGVAAPADGVVAALAVAEGALVEEGAAMAVVEPATGPASADRPRGGNSGVRTVSTRWA